MIATSLLRAAREQSNTLDAGESYDSAEAARDLDRLNRLISRLVVRAKVAKLISANTAGQSGYAYQCDTSGGSITLTLPAFVREGQQFSVSDMGSFASHALLINPNGRLINGSASVASVTANATWFFRADTGNWEKVRDLTLTDTVYFPGEMVALLITILAGELAPIYGPPLDAKMVGAAEAMFRMRYGRRGGAQ